MVCCQEWKECIDEGLFVLIDETNIPELSRGWATLEGEHIAITGIKHCPFCGKLLELVS